MNYEKRFLQLLDMIATMCGQKLTPELVVFYDSKLAPLGYQRVCAVLEELAENPRKFPTIGEVKAALGEGKQSGDARAVELPHLVWAALETHHSNPGREEAIRRMVGDDGLVLIARLGGWRHLLNIATHAAKTTLIAQWRDVAKAITPDLVQAHLAELEQARLPPAPARAAIEAAAERQDTTHYGSRKGTPETMAKLAAMRRGFHVVR